MRLTSIKLKNYKCLVDIPRIALRPLTILVGPNSSGKTSLLQWLLALHQTASCRTFEIPLLTDGPAVKLGPFADFVSFREKGRELEFSISIDYDEVPGHPYELEINGQEIQLASSGSILSQATLRYNQARRQLYLTQAKFQIPLLEEKWATVTVDRKRSGSFRLRAEFEDSTWNCSDCVPWNCFSAQPLFYDERDSQANQWWSTLLWWVQRSSVGAMNKIIHLGPLREEPHRFYVSGGEAPPTVGSRGEYSVPLMWLERHKTKAQQTGLLSQIENWLADLGMADGLKLSSIAPGVYDLRLTDISTGMAINLVDVGFGVSQVLPLAVQTFYAPPDSVLLIEQPEIHLHPRAQAAVADMLIAGASNKTLVVETHSEHILARIQRRIAEQRIDASSVGIYYFLSKPEGTQVTEVKVNDLGQFEPETLPEGFFTEELEEAFAYSKILAKRSSGGER